LLCVLFLRIRRLPAHSGTARLLQLEV
jgi:hypothetical protein